MDNKYDFKDMIAKGADPRAIMEQVAKEIRLAEKEINAASAKEKANDAKNSAFVKNVVEGKVTSADVAFVLNKYILQQKEIVGILAEIGITFDPNEEIIPAQAIDEIMATVLAAAPLMQVMAGMENVIPDRKKSALPSLAGMSGSDADKVLRDFLRKI